VILPHRPSPSIGSRWRAIFAAVPKPPPRLKVQRAKVIVTDAGVKRLSECESCGEEKYIAEGEGVCDECKSYGGLVLVKRKRKPKS
jgi:hypothetical protein